MVKNNGLIEYLIIQMFGRKKQGKILVKATE